MIDLFHVLLFFHFLGLALGFTVGFSNIVMSRLIAVAAPPEKVVLGRFPPAVSQLGRVGLVLLWLTGLTMVYTRFGGMGNLPWTFHVKLTAVVLLTLTTEYIQLLLKKVRNGDVAAASAIENSGKAAMLFALLAMLFAVMTFG